MNDVDVEFLTDAKTAPLDEIDDVLMRAYKTPSRRRRIERFFALDACEVAVVRHRGRVVSFGGFIVYPSGGFGWLAMIATDPNFERRGFGRLLTEHLIERMRMRNCAVALDASSDGAPLYEQMGFQDFGHCSLFTHSEIVSDQPTLRRIPDIAYAPIDNTLWQEVIAYDQIAFGANRGALLRRLATEFPGRSVLLLQQQVVVGYGIAQHDSIGPVVANDTTIARSIVSSLLELPWTEPPTLVVPPESAFDQEAETLGFALQRTLRRQHLGIGPLPGVRNRLAAQASLGEG